MRGLFSIFLLTITLSSFSQKGATTSAGENTASNGKIVSWSIGSTITGSFKTSTHRVYTGDLHPTYFTFYQEKNNKIKLDCFPNPTTEYFNLELHTNEFEGMAWILYNTKGKRVKSGKLESNNITIYVNNLSAASYLLNIYDSKKQVVADAKLIKK